MLNRELQLNHQIDSDYHTLSCHSCERSTGPQSNPEEAHRPVLRIVGVFLISVYFMSVSTAQDLGFQHISFP